MNKQNKTALDHTNEPALKSEALDWFMRLKEDHSAKTAAEFSAWLEADSKRLQAYEKLEIMYSLPALMKATQSDKTSRHNSTATRRAAYTAMPSRRVRRAGLIGFMCFLLLIGGFQFQTFMIWWQADYQTAYGQQQVVTLADGSTVILNTGSAISVDYTDLKRHVILLRGEAFFDVQHNKTRPFIVTGKFSDVEVTGTAFGVRTESTGDTVVLERGSVSVNASEDPAHHVQLLPGEMVTVFDKTVSAVQNTEAARDLAWKEGRIIFHNRSFKSAIADLSRYYSGTVLVLKDTSHLPAVSGNYRIDDPESAIRTFATSANLVATRLPGDIFILR